MFRGIFLFFGILLSPACVTFLFLCILSFLCFFSFFFFFAAPCSMRSLTSRCVCVSVGTHVCLCSVVSDSFVTPQTVARQGPLFMGFSWQDYWSGLPFPPSEELPHPGVQPASPTSLALAVGFFTTITTREAAPKWKESESHSVVSDSLWSPGLSSPWNSPGQNTGVGNLSLLQGVFPTQGLNSSLPHCRQILYQLSHKGSPRTLEWVA